MNRNRNIAIGCGLVVVFMMMFSIVIGLVTAQFRSRTSSGNSVFSNIKTSAGGEKIGLIYLTGVIHSGRSGGGLMGEQTSGSDTLVNLLESAGRDESIKAVVLRVNTPGGSPAGSQEIYNEIMRLKSKYKKPVIVSMGDVAASGGYYVSSAADTIFADPATLTGSIGVIMSLLNYNGLFEKVGLESVVMKSGKYKDIGSPTRKMTPEEQAILQSAIDDLHQQFMSDVAVGRKMKLEEVVKIADGRFFTGEQAMRLKLVDKMGGLRDAIEYAAKKTGLDMPVEVENLQKENPFSALFGSTSQVAPGMMKKAALQQAVEALLLNPVLNPQ
ncbi:MAG: signal peptide peptidase SppA [bacterium]